MSMETEIDNTLTNNISQHPRVDCSGGNGVADPSVSNMGLAASCALGSIPQVAGEDELQSRGLTRDVAHRQSPVYHGAYVDGFVQGDHPQLAKTAPVDAAGGETLKTW